MYHSRMKAALYNARSHRNKTRDQNKATKKKSAMAATTPEVAAFSARASHTARHVTAQSLARLLISELRACVTASTFFRVRTRNSRSE